MFNTLEVGLLLLLLGTCLSLRTCTLSTNQHFIVYLAFTSSIFLFWSVRTGTLIIGNDLLINGTFTRSIVNNLVRNDTFASSIGDHLITGTCQRCCGCCCSCCCCCWSRRPSITIAVDTCCCDVRTLPLTSVKHPWHYTLGSSVANRLWKDQLVSRSIGQGQNFLTCTSIQTVLLVKITPTSSK